MSLEGGTTNYQAASFDQCSGGNMRAISKFSVQLHCSIAAGINVFFKQITLNGGGVSLLVTRALFYFDCPFNV